MAQKSVHLFPRPTIFEQNTPNNEREYPFIIGETNSHFGIKANYNPHFGQFILSLNVVALLR
jgi:hypothetical protein